MHKNQSKAKNFNNKLVKAKLAKEELEKLSLDDQQVSDAIREAYREDLATNTFALAHYAEASIVSGAIVASDTVMPMTLGTSAVATAGIPTWALVAGGVVVLGGIATAGGGSSNTSAVDTGTSQPKVAFFIDSVVEGVDYYINGEFIGQTGANGSFPYTAGDHIALKIAGITLGELTIVPDDHKIFLQDLVGVDRSNVSDLTVIKLAQILQTLDSDNNPDNGIIIDVSKLKDNLSIVVTGDTIIENLFDNGTNIVTPEDAVAHMEEMIGYLIQDGSNSTPILALGQTGSVMTDFEGANDFGKSVIVDSQGHIIVAGYAYNGSSYDFSLARYNIDGSLDTSFGDTGIVMTDFVSTYDRGFSVSIDSNGLIVVAGSVSNGYNSDFSIARYNNDGSLDTSFTTGSGQISTNYGDMSYDGYSIVLDSGGRTIVAGYAHNSLVSGFAIARYNTDGMLDTSFGENGKAITDFSTGAESGQGVAIDKSGNMVVAGYVYNGSNYDFAMARYSENGNLDTSFGTNGMVTTDFTNNYEERGYSIAIDNNNHIIIAGYAYNGVNNDFAIARYNSDGSLDTSFGNNGKVTTDFGNSYDERGYSVVIDDNGLIMVAGYSYNGSDNDFALVRYNENGSLDTSFGTNGIVITDFVGSNDYGNSVTIDSDGNILVTGYAQNGSNYDFAVARYNQDGVLDENFGMDIVAYDNVNPVILSPDATLYDLESILDGSYDGGILSISRDGGANTDDNFDGSNLLMFDGANVLYSGVDVGNFSEVGGILSIAFDSDATQAVVDGILSSITYSNTNFTDPIVLNWVYSDGIISTTAQQSVI